MLKRWCSIEEIEVYLLCEILTSKDTVTSAASVDDHNKSSSQITVYYHTQRLLYSARSEHQKPPLQRVSPFYT